MNANANEVKLRIELQYFKHSGKFYTSALLEEPVEFLHEATAKVRELQKQGRLPGLNSGKWDGCIYVDFDGVPAIIKPQPTPAEPASEGKLQIVEGKYYRNRKGEKIGPLVWNKEDDDDNYPWIGSGSGYTIDGRYWFTKTEPDEKDLIAPWTEPATEPAPAEAAGVEGKPDPGEGWRLLERHEEVLEGDEFVNHAFPNWEPTHNHKPSGSGKQFPFYYRRRIPAPESVPSVDLWQHEREEYRKAIDSLMETKDGLQSEISRLDRLYKAAEHMWHSKEKQLEAYKAAESKHGEELAAERKCSCMTALRMSAEIATLQQQLADVKANIETKSSMYATAYSTIQDRNATISELEQQLEAAKAHPHDYDLLQQQLAETRAELAKAKEPMPAVQEEWREPDDRDRDRIIEVSSNNIIWYQRQYLGRIDNHAMPWVAEIINGIPRGYAFARVRQGVSNQLTTAAKGEKERGE